MKILLSTEKWGDTVWTCLSRNLTAFVNTAIGEAENIEESPTWYGLGEVDKDGNSISNPWDFELLQYQYKHNHIFYVLDDIYEVEQLLFNTGKLHRGAISFNQIIQSTIEALENTPIPRTDSQLEERYIDLL